MSHPEPETLAAYHAGELTAAEERRLQDHLVACRECATLLLDLDGLADPGFGAGFLSAADQQALWERIQGEIKQETPEKPPAPVIPLRRPARSAAPPRWLQALAASLLIVTLGLSTWVVSLRRTVNELARPQVNAPMADLFSGATRSEGSPRPGVSIPANEPAFILILHPPRSRSTTRYRVEITRASGDVVWRQDGVPPDPRGSLPLRLSPHWLGPGEYRIRLFEETGKKQEPILDNELRIESP
jgi:hypothetical protein